MQTSKEPGHDFYVSMKGNRNLSGDSVIFFPKSMFQIQEKYF